MSELGYSSMVVKKCRGTDGFCSKLEYILTFSNPRRLFREVGVKTPSSQVDAGIKWDNASDAFSTLPNILTKNILTKNSHNDYF